MSLATLIEAVERFAAAAYPLTEHQLNQPSYRWADYEQVRYAFLHTTLELRQLAAGLLQMRYRGGQYPTYAHHLLARHQQMYRECLALLTGISDEDGLRPPAPHEWPVQRIILHIYQTERYFYAAIRNALNSYINQTPAPPLPDEPEKIYALAEETGTPETEEIPLSDLKKRWATLHSRIVYNLSDLKDLRLNLVAPMWESTAYPVRFRMHRLETHLQEHTNQLEKTLIALGWLTEPRLLLRQMYNALGEVEGAIIGTGIMGYSECMNAAAIIHDRVAELQTAVRQSEAILTAVKEQNLAAAQDLLTANPALVNNSDSDGLFLITKAAYNQDWAMVNLLLEAGAFLDLHEAAAAGSLKHAQAWLQHSPNDLHTLSRDGYTPLQLSRRFNHEEVIHYLLEQGAEDTNREQTP